MNNEIKPCPFCGGKPDIKYFDMDDVNNIDKDCEIKCKKCDVLFIFCGQHTTPLAIIAWNKRHG